MATARSRVVLLTTLYRATRIAMRPGSPSLLERLSSVPRMLSSTIAGRYGGVSVGRLAVMAGAVAYIISPIDLVPEGALLLFGVLDDAVVLSWLAAALVTETESFLTWEREADPAGAASAAWPVVPSVVSTDPPSSFSGVR
ncbi:MAG: YkvA family protein [Dermatophilaceae bacterium]|nr:DUF1232 domain-containing protein [Intrasporangiaceae bacterium]